MRYPFGLVFNSTKHLAANKLRGRRKFPLLLSLEPLGSSPCCKANGNGSGAERPMLTVEQCLTAMKECPTPIVSINGAEPLEYPEIAALTRAVLEAGHYLFLSTDG